MSTKDWIEKDFYKVLGVTKDAKPEEIKKAYRKLARQNHPDQNPGNTAAEQRFKEISEANDVLSHEAKRKEYDEARRLFGGGGFRFPGTGGQRVRRSVGRRPVPQRQWRRRPGRPVRRACSTAARRRVRPGSPPRAGRGGAATSRARSPSTSSRPSRASPSACRWSPTPPCEACHGTGAKAGTIPHVCPTCEGSGMQTSTSGGVFAVTEPCRDCRGRGMVVDDPCPVCHGSGRGKSTKTMQVRIPAGVTDGQRIRLKGKGGAGENGGAPGDLYVIVHVRPHPIFGRKGDNLTLTAPVTFTEAALGAEIEVPTLGGPPVKLRVPPGTPNGRTFRVRGKGVAKRDGTRGDLLVTIEVMVPEALNEQARQALSSYAEAVGASNPRAKLFATR